MSTDNPYKTPSSSVTAVPKQEAAELATRWQRFAAMFIDALASGIVAMPIAYFFGLEVLASESTPGSMNEILISAISFSVFIVLNCYLMFCYGQTIGKRAIGIQVVDMSEEVPKLRTQIFLRYLPTYGMGPVPIVGGLYLLVDALLIFGNSRRCIHDYLAGTKVIKVT